MILKNIFGHLDGKKFDKEEYLAIQQEENKQLRNDKMDEFMDKYPNSKEYFNIEGTDAQEYTTWQEHLHILEKMGKIEDSMFNITPDQIDKARKLFSSSKSKKELSADDLALIKLVMQPMKPVYTGQVYDSNSNSMRVMYIKSSSFPLIPQLTQGFEINKLRKAMENLQKTSMQDGAIVNHVRASYQTANKVGASETPIEIFDNNGIIDEKALTVDKLKNNAVLLPRSNFGVQLEVPFKSFKKKNIKYFLINF